MAPRPIKLRWEEPFTGKKRTKSFRNVDTARIAFAKKKASKAKNVVLSMPLISFLDIEIDHLKEDAA